MPRPFLIDLFRFHWIISLKYKRRAMVSRRGLLLDTYPSESPPTSWNLCPVPSVPS